MCSWFYPVPFSNGTGLPERREPVDLYRNSGFQVVGEVVELTKFLHDLILTHELLGLSTHPTSSLKEVDWWGEWFKVHGCMLRECLVEPLSRVKNTRALRANVGEDSFEEMSMTFVVANFLGGFLVDDESLEAIFLRRIKKEVVNGFSQVSFMCCDGDSKLKLNSPLSIGEGDEDDSEGV
ncbi:hypothetical protein Tco_0804656 [Tanacetum coccineum]|uniref:Uncharacterized protein n=1 Tax=Tanacetum coccineum TaxID=301880 RepID=A0ABQ5A997_9ASTR